MVKCFLLKRLSERVRPAIWRTVQWHQHPRTDISLYGWYIAIGFLYVIVKIIFVARGYLHTGAIFHGLIPAALTVTAGFWALSVSKRRTGVLQHKILIVLPVLSLIVTPVYMYLKEREMWLANGRLPVLIIYEILAAVQLIMALRSLQHNHRLPDGK
jgi:hypothetical protein